MFAKTKAKAIVRKKAKSMSRWVKNEDGFEVFEKFGLTQGGVVIALGVTAVAIYFMNQLWSGVAGTMGEDFSTLDPTAAASMGWSTTP